MKLTDSRVEALGAMNRPGSSVRELSRRMGVTEGALRYRLRQRRLGGRRDGRAEQPTALDGCEEAVVEIQRAPGDGRLTGEGRPAEAREIWELRCRDHRFRGSCQAVVRHLRRRYGVPRQRAYRRVETAPGVQAQHDRFELRVPRGEAEAEGSAGAAVAQPGEVLLAERERRPAVVAGGAPGVVPAVRGRSAVGSDRLASLAGCMAIDVVLILERMRTAPARLAATVSGDRAEEHPRRFTRIRLEFTAFGGAVVPDRLERAVQLSFEKYCSVLHSLGKDIDYDWSATVAAEAP